MELFMRKLILATASLAALAVAAPAFAQDGPPNPDSDKTFSGPRAGIILGYDRMQPGQVPNSSIDDSNSADGLTGMTSGPGTWCSAPRAK
jgi:outer membrane immunogenic protein